MSQALLLRLQSLAVYDGNIGCCVNFLKTFSFPLGARIVIKTEDLERSDLVSLFDAFSTRILSQTLPSHSFGYLSLIVSHEMEVGTVTLKLTPSLDDSNILVAPEPYHYIQCPFDELGSQSRDGIVNFMRTLKPKLDKLTFLELGGSGLDYPDLVPICAAPPELRVLRFLVEPDSESWNNVPRSLHSYLPSHDNYGNIQLDPMSQNFFSRLETFEYHSHPSVQIHKRGLSDEEMVLLAGFLSEINKVKRLAVGGWNPKCRDYVLDQFGSLCEEFVWHD
ncbi:hypothetical protein AX16_000830 [Volvariella volvacea WC 439]|nr:hypothetical protein AX16_000830 [Volvariella volvacea WC 439]